MFIGVLEARLEEKGVIVQTLLTALVTLGREQNSATEQNCE
ncbi:hypothetical protein Hdeb2414_s0024g00653841 [Helianthus debilis subsp. tardiflorus]